MAWLPGTELELRKKTCCLSSALWLAGRLGANPMVPSLVFPLFTVSSGT